MIPPRFGTSTGVPKLIASAATIPNGSRWIDGYTTHRLRRNSADRSSLLTRPFQKTVSRRCSAIASIDLRYCNPNDDPPTHANCIATPRSASIRAA